mgnify:CR=1 FL=1
MITIETAQQFDAQDALQSYAEEFYKKPGQIYLDGNSLGLLSKRAETSVIGLLNSWKEHGIDGWTAGEQPWYYFSENLGELCAPLVGAKKQEVVLTGSTTTNLHQLLATFFKPTVTKNKILADELNLADASKNLYIVIAIAVLQVGAIVYAFVKAKKNN